MTCCDGDRILPRGTRLFTRRDLLALVPRVAGAALVSSALVDLLGRHALAQGVRATAGRKRLVLLWLDGGPSQVDTFDPKPGAPTAGPFKAIPTDVDGWFFSEHLAGLAKRAEHFSMVRTLTSKEGSHSRARDLLHFGYAPNPSVPFPVLGSIAAHEVGDLDHDLPAFVQIDGIPGSAGYLGTPAAPFYVKNPSGRIENLTYRRAVDAARMDAREQMRDVIDDEFARSGTTAERAIADQETQRRRARRLMDSKLRGAFDLTQEPSSTIDAYGGSRFGRGVLLARRLLEHGVAAVEVVLEGWDTHQDNFNRTRDLSKQVDPALSTLIDDLRQRGLYDDTLVVCMGEFGRTPEINGQDGRDHWPSNSCVLLGGGGIRGGRAIGATDERGMTVVTRPVQVADLYASIAQALGIEREKVFQATTKRPVKLVDPNGSVVSELFG